MTDPLSITLAAITLITALRDLIELAQKLEKSFAQVSANFRHAESMAAEIRQTLEQLNDFCEEHQEILSNAQDMEKSLLGLMTEMKSVFVKSCEMVPTSTERKLDKLKITIGAWKNRNKVESALRELRHRVNKCYAKFMLFAVIRIEKRLLISSNDHAQGLKIMRNEISNIRVSDERLVAFVGTSSGTPSSLPPEINADYISDSYLRLQIRNINKLVQLSSTRSYPVERPTAAYLRPFLTGPTLTIPNDRTAHRQEVIAKSLAIQTLLQHDSSSVSVQEGASTMVGLAIGLSFLEMPNEAAVIGLWTVKLFRALLTTNSTIYSPYLALSLLNLCFFYMDINNMDDARSAIRECLSILGGPQVSLNFFELSFAVGLALMAAARVCTLDEKPTESLTNAQKSVLLFEAAFSKRHTLYDASQIGPIGNFELAQVSTFFPSSTIYNYVRALRQLSTSLQRVGRSSDAVKAEMRASEILTYLAPLSGSRPMELELANTFYRLSHEEFREFVDMDRALPMSQQSVAIFKKYCEKDRRKHIRSLCNALWQNGKLLGEMKRYDEALIIWEETANLAGEIMKDQLLFANALYEVCRNLRLLTRYDEAAIARTKAAKVYQSILKSTSVTEAHAYYDLAVDLRLGGRYPESIRAAQMAVIQYRALVFKDPDQYTKNLAKGLTSLTNSFVLAGQKEQAFNEGHEALRLYEALIRDDSSVLQEFIWSLTLNWFVAWVSDNETKAVERSQDVIRHSRELAKRFPPSTEDISELIRAIIHHSLVLANFDRFSEASVAIEEALDCYDKNPAISHKPVSQHMCCLIEIGSHLDQQGYTQQALVPIRKSIDVGTPFSSEPSVASLIAGSMHRHAQLFLEMGWYLKGVVASKEAVAFAREATLENVTELIGCLQVASLAYTYSGQAEEAISSTNEALELCRGEALAKLAKASATNLLYLPRCLQILSCGLAIAGREAEALRFAQEAVDEALKLKSQAQYPTIPRSMIEPIYMNALFNYSIRISASNNLPLALELLLECRAYYEQHAEARNTNFRILACVLYAEAMIHCAAGRHEDGIATRTKLYELQKRLQTVFPSLARLVEIELEAFKSSSSWTALVAGLDLRCQHQDERLETHIWP